MGTALPGDRLQLVVEAMGERMVAAGSNFKGSREAEVCGLP